MVMVGSIMTLPTNMVCRSLLSTASVLEATAVSSARQIDRAMQIAVRQMLKGVQPRRFEMMWITVKKSRTTPAHAKA